MLFHEIVEFESREGMSWVVQAMEEWDPYPITSVDRVYNKLTLDAQGLDFNIEAICQVFETYQQQYHDEQTFYLTYINPRREGEPFDVIDGGAIIVHHGYHSEINLGEWLFREDRDIVEGRWDEKHQEEPIPF